MLLGNKKHRIYWYTFMFNNPYNLTAEEFCDSYGVYQTDPDPYVIFGAQVVRNNALHYTLNRIVRQRDNTYNLIEDHAWFHSEAPEWLRGDN